MPDLRCSLRPVSCDRSLRAQAEHVSQFVVGQFGQPALAGPDHPLGSGLLGLDHQVDPLLQGAGAHELVHLDVAGLTDAEGPVRAWFSTAGFHQRS